MSWDTVGRSIERDVTKVAAAVVFGLVTIGVSIGIALDALWRRHRQ